MERIFRKQQHFRIRHETLEVVTGGDWSRIPKNDPIYDERMAVLRARHAGILDEVKLTDGLGKILVDDYKLVHSEKKVPSFGSENGILLEQVISLA
ncbi:hypothetical protein B9Z55_026076 [Caenorhabditis nigoni]|uniref:Uncharacterized protein n=1 Tax=Caenorhabditis nigoni TaxID=1611254 RepID=A0A2G5T1N1_9PELO|nr:hypothetical protein B9Z55_026076 [Caenorhabditis nigoni]